MFNRIALALAISLGLATLAQASEMEVSTGANKTNITGAQSTQSSSAQANTNKAQVTANKDSEEQATSNTTAANAQVESTDLYYSPFTKDEFLKESKLCEELFTQKDKHSFATCNPIANTHAAGPKLQYIMAHIYFEGIGVARNNDQGLNWLYRAYNSGNVEAKKDLGIFSLNIYLSNHNLGTGRTGFNLLSDAAKAGNKEAAYFLADLKKRKEFSELGAYDPKISFQDMKKLADTTSYLPAMIATSEMYITGVGTNADALTGYALLEKAANLGSADALKQMSLLEEANDKLENKYKSYLHQYAYTTCYNTSDNMRRLEKLSAGLSKDEINKAQKEADKLPKLCK